MDKQNFSVSGRITTKDGQGVFGLKVVAYDKDLLFDDRLGASVTAEDGSFRLKYSEAAFRDLFEAKPDVYIEALDCTGKKVFSSAAATKWQAGKDVRIDAEIPEAKLQDHFEQSHPLVRLGGGLVAAEKLDAIDEAAELLQSRIDQGLMPSFSGTGRPPRLGDMVPLSAAYCPAPDILGFDDLLDTAWGVLFDDPRAVSVFEDILDTVFYRFRVRAPEVAATMAKDWAEDRPLEFEALTEVVKAKRDILPLAPADSLMEQDRLLVVMAAAVIAAGGDRVVENRYLGTLMGQFNALAQLDKVYRAARGALSSNPHGVPGFGNLLGHVGGTCGPDDGPWPFPPRRDDLRDIHEILRLEMIHCMADMVRASRSGALAGGSYEILSADFSDGCPGSPVVLTGTNFEGLFPDRNRVIFPHQNGVETILVEPASASDWTDTRIEVAVPAEAGPGPVSLYLVGNYASVCGKAILPPRHGNSMDFSGGASYIRRFTADHRDGSFTVAPGDTVTLRWVVVPSSADVHLRVVQDGTVIVNEDVPVEGSRDIAIPVGSVSETVCTLTADNACPGSDSRTITMTGCEIADLAIHGIEVTQAIQYYRSDEHLTYAVTDPVPDNNSAQLVADKPAWVRVYLRSGLSAGFNSGQLPDVAGSLVIDRRVGGVWSNVTTLSPVNAPYTAEESFPSYQQERGNIDASLNFIVPANVMTGLLRMRATVSSTAQCAGSATSDSVTVDVNLQQQLQVAALRIGYDGPNAAGTANVVFAAPPLNGPGNSVAGECDFALSIYPVSSNLNLRDLGTDDASAPLNDTAIPAGGCDANWSPTIGLVANARTNDGNQPGWIYFGFVTDNIPIIHGNIGCASGGNAAGIVGMNPVVFAHEAGHQMGLPHSPCGGVGTPNPAYPTYLPYDTTPSTVNAAGVTIFAHASIGEFGLDINNGDILDPSTAKDYMSYCDPEWVSLYSHDYMSNNAVLNPVALSTGFATAMADTGGGSGFTKNKGSHEPRPRITMIGYVDAEGEVSISSVARTTVHPPRMTGEATDYEAQLIGESGKAVNHAPVFTLPHRFHQSGRPRGGAQPKGGKGPFHFIAVMDDVEDGQRLQILKGEEVVWRKERPVHKPKLKQVEAVLTKDDRLQLSWSYETPPAEEAEIWLRWSGDQGETWNGLAVNRRGTSAALPTDGLPAGSLTFEVVAHDGFYSVSAESPPVEIPERAPLLSILRPRSETLLAVHQPLRLLASATMRSRNVLSDDRLVWFIDEQEVGRGRDIWVNNPGKGNHEIKLIAEDPAGEAIVRINISVE